VAYGSALAVGDILGIVVDTGAGTITFYKNGTSLGVAYSGLSGTFVFCAVGATAGTNSSVSANFGQRPFSYTYGSAVALNTYNM
jgi:Kip1 ubiquitination-promoting complex protein 1